MTDKSYLLPLKQMSDLVRITDVNTILARTLYFRGEKLKFMSTLNMSSVSVLSFNFSFDKENGKTKSSLFQHIFQKSEPVSEKIKLQQIENCLACSLLSPFSEGWLQSFRNNQTMSALMEQLDYQPTK